MTRKLVVLFCALVLMVVLMVSCGGDGDEATSANCSLEQSELGPFSSDAPGGGRIGEDEARARMAEDGVVEWIRIEADGPWRNTWDVATDELGTGIHLDLTWIDAEGDLIDLYNDGQTFGFDGLRVSRSFQGKIESAEEALFVPVREGEVVNFGASCEVTALIVGDAANPRMLDVFDLTAAG